MSAVLYFQRWKKNLSSHRTAETIIEKKNICKIYHFFTHNACTKGIHLFGVEFEVQNVVGLFVAESSQ